MKPNVTDYVNQYAKAIYDFSSEQEVELTLTKGDIIQVTSAVDDNWLCGVLKGKRGNFPLSFVEKIVIPAVQIGQKVFGATESFPAFQDGDLEFRKGAVIVGSRKVDDSWWEGSYNGKHGIFPITHVMELEVPASLRERSKSVHSSEPMFARALCDAVAQLDDELSFRTGDMITVLEVIDSDWYYGELGSKQGIFLSSCVELLQDTTNMSVDEKRETSIPYNNNKVIVDGSNVPVSNAIGCSAAAQQDMSSSYSSTGNAGHFSRSQTLPSQSVITDVKKQGVPSYSDVQSSHMNSVLPDSEILPYGKTLYPFVGQSPDELTFRENEMVYLIQHVDDQWIEGELDGKIGLFPTAFVSIIVDCPHVVSNFSEVSISDNTSDVPHVNNITSNTQQSESLHEKANSEKKVSNTNIGTEKYGLVRYTFVPEADGDLGLNEGDTVTIMKQVDENWVMVQNDLGHQGMCPKNFVEILGESPEEQPTGENCISNQIMEKNQTDNVSAVTKQSTESVTPKLEQQNVPKKHTIKPKPVLGPKPLLKPKPALLPKPAFKPTAAIKAVHSSPGFQSLDDHSLPKSPSSSSLSDATNHNGGSFPKPSSAYELFSVGLHENDGHSIYHKPVENVCISNHLDSLITDEMNKAKQEADSRSRSSSTHSNVSSGSSGSLQKSSDSDNSVSLRTKRPPPLNLGSNSNRHSVNFPVSFDVTDDHVSRIDSSRRSVMNTSAMSQTFVRSVTVESGYSAGNSTFFLDPVIDQSTSKKPVPMRKPPPPPHTTGSVSVDVDSFDRKPSLRKPPPPRPKGPRVTSPPSTQQKSTRRLVPQRAAPGPPKATKVPSRPAPPCPAACPPPKRPPPRAPQAVVISEEVREKIEANSEIIGDLKNRIQEVEKDLENYKKCKSELEHLVEVSGDEKEGSVYDNIDFYNANIEGLSEELFRLRESLTEVCPEEVDFVTQQMEEEARRQEQEKQREEEKKKNEEMKEKRKEKRQKVRDELIDTEKGYLQCLQLCIDTFLGPIAEKHPEVDIEMIFGNMEEITDVSQKLLTEMEGAVCAKHFSEQCIGPCFVSLAEDMKNVYAPYCRNHDDVITLIEKYKGNTSISEYFEMMLNKVREEMNVFDLEALLIRPVQRIMKYPLLLNELIKTTEDDHPDKSQLLNAINSMTDVATAINEYKRRKDLVYKYKKETDQTFGDKLAKLSLHSLKKKGSRFKGRLSTTIGLSPQTKDETFDKEATRFMQLEKSVKVFVRDVQVYIELIQDSVRCHDSMVADMEDFCEETCSSMMVQKFRQVHDQMEQHFLPEFERSVSELVVIPMSKLSQFFEAPNKVMQKRFDKLLDYDSMLKKVKDDKVTEKAMQTVRNDYEALNAQLLDELPKLYNLSFQLLQECIAAFISARQRYSESILHRMSEILDISSLLNTDSSVVDVFNFKHVSIVDKMSLLSFIPKGFNPRMEPQKPEKKAKRQSVDVTTAKVSAETADSSQSDSQRAYILHKYPADKLYCCTEAYTATDAMDLSLPSGILVGVIMEKDPMGNQNRWFVDNGEAKGFVLKTILTSYQASASPNMCPSLPVTTVLQPVTVQQTVMDDTDEFDFALEEDMSPEVTEVSNVSVSNNTGEFYYAEYEFESRAPNEVSLFEGQVVTVYIKHDEQGNKEWWYVDADGVKGYAPSVYLQPMS